MNIHTIILHYPNKPYAVISEVLTQPAAQFSACPNGQTFNARALWDTGAQMCAISKALADAMGLKPQGNVGVGGFGGEKKDTPYYRVDLILPDNRCFYSVAVAEYAESHSHDIIIGMNLITMGDFALTREETGIRFTFTMDQM
jgi:hypothetical protein